MRIKSVVATAIMVSCLTLAGSASAVYFPPPLPPGGTYTFGCTGNSVWVNTTTYPPGGHVCVGSYEISCSSGVMRKQYMTDSCS